MKAERINEIIALINREVKPALGCTEPVAVALASANANKALDEKIENITVLVSGNVLKNGMGVGIPGTGMVGLYIASALGAIGGDPDAELKVLERVSKQDIINAKKLVQEKRVTVENADTDEKLYIKITLSGKIHNATCTISGNHTNIVSITRDGKSIIEKSLKDKSGKECGKKKCDEKCLQYNCSSYHTTITIEEIFIFATTVPLERIQFLLDGAKLNKAIAHEALENNYGLNVGKMIKSNVEKHILNEDITTVAMSLAAAAADARMSGSVLPVMSNSGSGNQGITIINPIVAVSEFTDTSEEKLLRALAIGHLVAIHLKEYMDKLSAFCGVVSAATGASSGVTYLLGGNSYHIKSAIKNMIGNISGMFCDGAKPGCALKVSTAVSAAIQSALLAINEVKVSEYEGIIEDDIEKTIKNLALIASKGMIETDKIILNIMTCK